MKHKRYEYIYLIEFKNDNNEYIPGTLNESGGFYLTKRAAMQEVQSIRFLDPGQQYRLARYRRDVS